MVETDYEKYFIKEPFVEPRTGGQVLYRTYPPLVYMSSRQVPEARYYIQFGWVWGLEENSYGYCEEVGKFDEVIINIGGDYREPEDLGAELEYSLGGQNFRIRTTGAIFIPAGVKHGLVNYYEVRKPYVQIRIIIGSGVLPEGNQPFFKTSESQLYADYSEYIVKKPAYEVVAGTPVKGRQGPSSMTFMSNNLVSGCNIYIEGGWVWDMPDPNPHIFEHAHDYEEIVVHFGTDYQNPQKLGAEIEFQVGGQPLMLNRTSAVFIPQGVKHGPLVWKHFISPHFEMAVLPGAGTLDEADPGGHQKNTERRNQND